MRGDGEVGQSGQCICPLMTIIVVPPIRCVNTSLAYTMTEQLYYFNSWAMLRCVPKIQAAGSLYGSKE